MDQRDLREGKPRQKTLALPVWRLSSRPTTYSRKKQHVTETTSIVQSTQNPGGAEIANQGSMTTMGESQREAHRPTKTLVNPKTTFIIGHWNVRTMYRSGAAAEIAREMENYGIDILGISESRWTGAGRMKMSSGQTVIYSGDESLHEGGVAMMISQQAAKSLLEWTPINKRIIMARFYTKIRKMTIIQVYICSPQRERGRRKGTILHRTSRNS